MPSARPTKLATVLLAFSGNRVTFIEPRLVFKIAYIVWFGCRFNNLVLSGVKLVFVGTMVMVAELSDLSKDSIGELGESRLGWQAERRRPKMVRRENFLIT